MEIPQGFEQVQKVTEDGKPVFLLPQPDLETVIDVPKTVKATTETDHPVLLPKTVPHLDADGNQMQYEVTRSETSEDGEMTQVGTGQWIPCWQIESVQEQDEDGAPLFFKTVTVPESRSEAQPAIEITEDDERFTEGLEPAYELVALPVEPAPVLPKTAEQRLSELEASQRDIRKDVALTNEKVDATSENLQGFMDYTFNQ